jgi:hypothetical protein
MDTATTAKVKLSGISATPQRNSPMHKSDPQHLRQKYFSPGLGKHSCAVVSDQEALYFTSKEPPLKEFDYSPNMLCCLVNASFETYKFLLLWA